MIHSPDCRLAKIHPWVIMLGLFLLCSPILFLGARTGEGSTFSPLPDPTYSHELPLPILPVPEKVRHIIYPVIGFPALVVAGESLTALVSMEDGGKTQDWTMHITTHDRVSQTYTVGNITSRYDSVAGYYTIEGIIPPQVPRDVFDLTISSEGLLLADRQPNAVRVIKAVSDNFRFIHVTDLHIGAPRVYWGSPRDENSTAHPLNFVRQLFTELSFLDPEFILYSGDLVFGNFYPLEYPWSWEIISSHALPLFMVPGNHDGYTRGNGLLRDGLQYWKQTIGPTYYSFNYGDTNHFICINTYDGSGPQRDAINFIAQKWGGTLSQEQLEWLGKDLEEASDEEKNSIIIAHHDPRGNIHRFGGEINLADEDDDGYAEATEFLDTLFYQEWNDRESGEEVMRIIRENNTLHADNSRLGHISHIFLGHVHSDFVDWDEESNTWWVHTTSTGSAVNSRDDFFGYRIIEVESNQISRLNRTAPEGVVLPPTQHGETNTTRGYQSYPVNSIVVKTIQGSNDGTSTLVIQEVTNHLESAVAGRVKFYMPRLEGENGAHNNFGYSLSGGTVRTIARSGTDGDGDRLVFYVTTEVDPDDTKRVTLQESAP